MVALTGTVIDAPVPTNVPLQEPVYQLYCAPVPNEPPVAVRVTLLPVHTEVDEAVMPVGAVEAVLTLMVTCAQVVVLQVPSARTKYVVVEEGLTVMEVPLPSGVPPQVPLYHCQVAPVPNEPPVTVKVELLTGQMVVAVAEINAGAVETGLTVMVTDTQVVVLQGPSARTK